MFQKSGLYGLIKVPLFAGLPFKTFQKIGSLALWEAVFILELQFAETQECLTDLLTDSITSTVPTTTWLSGLPTTTSFDLTNTMATRY